MKMAGKRVDESMASARSKRPLLQHRRHFHATKQQPFWLVAAGLGCAGLYVATKYVVRAQDRIRRKRAGLDETNDQTSTPLKRMHDTVYGVDFGTSNLRIASIDAKENERWSPRVLVSSEGLRAIPSVVAIENGDVCVGAIANAVRGRKPFGYSATATRMLLEDKTLLPEEFQAMLKTLPYKVDTTADKTTLQLDGQSYSAQWAAEMLFEQLHRQAARHVNLDGDFESQDATFPIVLPVPVAANSTEWQQIAESAGFDVLATIPEPIAALHAVQSAHEGGELSGTIAVFDMGGYATTVSLIEKDQHQNFKLLASKSTVITSGKRLDALLCRQVMHKFHQEHHIDLSLDPMASFFRIEQSVETAKIELSQRNKQRTDLHLPYITADRHGRPKHLIQQLSSVDIERHCHDQATMLPHVMALCNDVLASARLSKQSIDHLVLIGGGSQIPAIRQAIERFFNQRDAFPTQQCRPDEAIVMGTTLAAHEMYRRSL